MTFITPEERAMVFRDTHQLLSDLNSGRVQAVIITRGNCPSCQQVDGISLNPMCPTCGGDGFINTRSIVQIPASIKWGARHQFEIEAVGKDDLGYCTIEVQPQWGAFFVEGAEVEIDGERVIINEICPTGIGQVSRIIIRGVKRVNNEDN